MTLGRIAIILVGASLPVGCIPSPYEPLGAGRDKTAPAAAGGPKDPQDSTAAPAKPPNTLPRISPPHMNSTPTQLVNGLIPRQTLFGNPQRARARISPDGNQLAFVAPRDGVLNIWVAPVDNLGQARPITNDRHRGIRSFVWAFTNRHVVYTKDEDGDEDFHVYSVNLATNEIKDLTPLENVSATISAVSEKFPKEILVGLNDRPPHQFHDVYRINVVTGARELLQMNAGFAGFVIDDDYRVRFAATYTPDGGQMYLQPDTDAESGWSPFLQIGPLDAMTTGLSGFDKSGRNVFMLDSRDRNTAVLKRMNLDTNEEQVLAESSLADVSGAIQHPTEKHIQAVTFTYARREWLILDDSIKPDLEYLQTVADGELQITSRTLDDRVWTVAYVMDNGPVQFYLYDRTQRQARFLFSSNPALEGMPLVKMHPVLIPARDGMTLVSYLSVPHDSDPHGTGRPLTRLPMVLNVHGGPWARDSWGYNSLHQMLANRGYAVLSVNYRGSTGFGKHFTNAANGEWAGQMHDDLVDAVAWAETEGISDPQRIAIMGGSYGGYATLVGLTFTPNLFACGVDIVGPSNLITLLENPPPYWMPFMPVLKNRVGDHETPAGREFLTARSPLTYVERIRKPLLIGQGGQDPRVKQTEADQIVAAMNQHGIPVTYQLFPQEGHGFARPENRMAFYAVAEAFLAEHLGGRYEPIGGAFEGAVFEVPSGRDGVPGLTAALDGAN